MSQIRFEELDWIIVTDPVEEISMDMEVIDYTEKDGEKYLLAIPAYDEEEEAEAELLEDDDAAFIFKVSAEEEAEYWVTEEYSDQRVGSDLRIGSDLRFGVTTMMSEEEFQSIAEEFEKSEEYDLEVEDYDDIDE